jgi:glycosyltransferase involved in cell wall biosynthesis
MSWALVVTDQLLVPPWGGNRVRILGIIRGLRRLGWRVALVTAHLAHELHGIVDEVVPVCGDPFRGGDLASFDAGPFRRAVAHVADRLEPSIAIAEYAWMAPTLLVLPKGVLRCVDCHDLLSERTVRFTAAGLDPWVVCTPDQERRLLLCADVLIASQHREAELLGRLVPGKRVVCLLPEIELPSGFRRASADSSIVLAVGANHAGNQGIQRFVALQWARVLDRVPDARIQVAGAIGSGIDPLPGVESLGRVVDMSRRYADAAVVLCPVEVGTGVKVKVLEALRFGKSVVATAAAVEGLPNRPHRPWLMADGLEECADAVITLLQNPRLRAQLEVAAFAYGERHLSRKSIADGMRSFLPNRMLQRLIELAGL